MDSVVYALVGAGFLLAAVVPPVVRGRAFSLPLAFLILGIGAFLLPLPLTDPDPVRDRWWIERLAEVTVILSLAGVGMRIDRPVGLRSWSSTWRLLGIAMPLTIAAVALLGAWAGLPLASALLLGAVLAPTDPVLAGDVQVAGPASTEPSGDGEARFALTSEAGLNDALAFPFVALAVLVAEQGVGAAGWLGGWLAVDVAWKIGAGALVGVLVGRFLAWLAFRAPGREIRLVERSEGFVILATTFLAYGAAELLHAYGFLAVFVGAVVQRRTESDHEFHAELVVFGEQVERLLIVVVLLLIGGSLAGGVLGPLTLRDAAVAVAVVALVRPLAAGAALVGGRGTGRERLVAAFFGVRGVGSVYYLAFALGVAEFADADRLWAIVVLAIVVSVVVFGLLATPTFDRLDRMRARRARRRVRV